MNAAEQGRLIEVADRIEEIRSEVEQLGYTMLSLYEAARPDRMGGEVAKISLQAGARYGDWGLSAELSVPAMMKLFAGEVWGKLEVLQAELEAMPRLGGE